MRPPPAEHHRDCSYRLRTTAAQRGHSVGCSASLPTSGDTFQQRSHFSPGATATSTVTPGKASPAYPWPAPFVTVTAETMNSVGSRASFWATKS